MSAAASAWDDARTARRYEWFCRRHRRYRAANDALVRHAALEPSHRVLDVGAGTGRTAEAALGLLGTSGRVVCVEPARAMRAVGERRLTDPRVSWRDALPSAAAGERFDRILCGAAIWLLGPFAPRIRELADLLDAGGALCFDVPSLYLGEPDEPGGGDDPLLLALPALVRARCAADDAALERGASGWPHSASAVSAVLTSAGLSPRHWEFRQRLSLAAYRDWLTIPVLSAGLAPSVASAETRASLVTAAADQLDRRSWRWERWSGWTAWKPAEGFGA